MNWVLAGWDGLGANCMGIELSVTLFIGRGQANHAVLGDGVSWRYDGGAGLGIRCELREGDRQSRSLIGASCTVWVDSIVILFGIWITVTWRGKAMGFVHYGTVYWTGGWVLLFRTPT